MANTKMAKVSYNSVEDKFELWIYSEEDDEWGFSCSTKCRAIEEGGETNFIHFTFLKEVLRCAELGYKIIEC